MRLDRVVTSGIFSLDGQDFDVDNNVWMVGDDNEVVVIDAAHDAETILAGVADRRLKAIISTHGHNDHINAAVEVATTAGCPIFLHPDDAMLWDVVYPEHRFDTDLTHGDVITVGGAELKVLHTPGHSPGGCCLYVPSQGMVFTGDTLFNGGPGATGRSFSSYDVILDSIEAHLFSLPADTAVHTGHGDSTSIGAEAPSMPDWRSKQE